MSACQKYNDGGERTRKELIVYKSVESILWENFIVLTSRI